MADGEDIELIERYQRAWVTRRRLRVVAREWRDRGDVEVLAEHEIALNEGREDACFWLLGKTPVAPVSAVPVAVTPETIAAELAHAQQLESVPSPDPDALLDSYAGRSDWARGVVDALKWAAERRKQAS